MLQGSQGPMGLSCQVHQRVATAQPGLRDRHREERERERAASPTPRKLAGAALVTILHPLKGSSFPFYTQHNKGTCLGECPGSLLLQWWISKGLIQVQLPLHQ